MKPNEIRAALVLAEVSQASLAAKLGVSRAAIFYVINGNRPSPRIRTAIAEAISKPVSEVFPDNQEAA